MFQPVIFIPGVTLYSGSFSQHFDYFKAKGYSEDELYTFSYGDGGYTPMFDKDMACEDVKRVSSLSNLPENLVFNSKTSKFLNS